MGYRKTTFYEKANIFIFCFCKHWQDLWANELGQYGVRYQF